VLGEAAREVDPTLSMGSTDMGDVSHVIPAIHPLLAICDEGGSMCHERSFAEHAQSERGNDAMLAAASSIALTAFDVLGDATLREETEAYFARQKAR
jgi:metal-dependent amidase/aminoacylase/carboxypeptidase family protein